MKWFFYITLSVSLLSCQTDGDHEKLRTIMVEDQIIERGIKDQRLLDIMRTIPRHEFVPEKYRSDAYEDGPLPIGYDQTIS
tara:strand:+ start:153 stop:395 length:243 start_codon:yes stop_codon:yes gene_type:complete